MELYCISILDKPFVFRALTRKECDGLNRSNQDEYEQRIEICKLSVLIPSKVDWHSLECGVPVQLAQCICESSGLIDGEKLLELGNEKAKAFAINAYELMEGVIMHVFPGYDINKLQDLSINKTVDLYAQAQCVLEFAERKKMLYQMKFTHELQQDQQKNNREIEAANQMMAYMEGQKNRRRFR